MSNSFWQATLGGDPYLYGGRPRYGFPDPREDRFYQPGILPETKFLENLEPLGSLEIGKLVDKGPKKMQGLML